MTFTMATVMVFEMQFTTRDIRQFFSFNQERVLKVPSIIYCRDQTVAGPVSRSDEIIKRTSIVPINVVERVSAISVG